MRESVAWCIEYDGVGLPYTVRRTRRQCIEDYEQRCGRPWDNLKKCGRRAVKVRVVSVAEAMRGAEHG